MTTESGAVASPNPLAGTPLVGVRRALLVHAHPDDETLSTGGLIALLVGQGTRVSLVTCTRGERGEVVPGALKPLEGTDALAPHRVGELAAACAALGVTAHCFLGEGWARSAGLPPRVYADSGMRWGADGLAEPVDDAGTDAFTSAPFEEPLRDLLAAVDTERPEVLISYDELGGYGHPDHRRAAELARAAAAARGIRLIAVPGPDGARADDVRVGIRTVLGIKRAALAAHASQLTLTDAGLVLSGGQSVPIADHELIRTAD